MRHARAISSLLVFATALAATSAFAAAGPEYRSLRGLSMGNAFVAVVDDKDALYYNPAGLNLINALGNSSRRPGLAAYPRNRMNARLNLVGASAPYGQAMDILDFYKTHKSAFKNDSAMRADPSWLNGLTQFDMFPVETGIMQGAEFSMHNFGAAIWARAEVAPYVDEGLFFPQGGIDRIQLDAVVQIAGARGFMNNRLAAGGGYRLANRQTVHEFRATASEMQDGVDPLIDRARDTLDEKRSGLTDVSNFGHGIDLGVLWQQTSWLRLGAALQNFGMYLENTFVTPELTVGAAVTPPLLSSGGRFPRKVNLALDFEDILNDDRNYKALSKVNFGAEAEQYLSWFASARLAGGFKGGYWTAGAGLSLFRAVHLEAASWAEEIGYYTGHIEDRFYAVRIGVGL